MLYIIHDNASNALFPQIQSNGNLRVDRRQDSQQQQSCSSDAALSSLLSDIFMGNEMIPDVVDDPPRFPLDLVYKTIRTFPGMKLTAEATR